MLWKNNQMPPPFIFQTRIRFIDTDASGRIHYTAMFRYFESAEIEFLRTLGINYDPKRSINFPRVHVECDFKMAMEHDDLIEIEVRVAHIGNSSVRFEFRTLKAAQLAATGIVVVVCMDRDTQRSISIPVEIRQKLALALSPDGPR
jgi:YbgC/YbaW family acyl-CoA thioester hydrolase